HGPLGDAERIQAVQERAALAEAPVAQERHALRVAQHLVATVAACHGAALARVAEVGERGRLRVDPGQHGAHASPSAPRAAAPRRSYALSVSFRGPERK